MGARTGDDTVRVGITDFAQSALGDVVFVQLPDVGTEVTAGESFGEVESTKSVSDLYAPVTAKVVAVNGDLEGSPQLVNSDPYGAGWLVDLQVDAASLEDGLARPARRGRLPRHGDGGMSCQGVRPDRIRRWWTQRRPPRGTVDVRRMAAGNSAGRGGQISPQQPVRSSG